MSSQLHSCQCFLFAKHFPCAEGPNRSLSKHLSLRGEAGQQQISWSKAGWTCPFNQNKQSKTTNKHCLALLKESLDLRTLIMQKLSGPPTFYLQMFPLVTWLAEKVPAAELCSLLNPLPWILTTRKQEGRLVTQSHGSIQAVRQTHWQLFNYTNLQLCFQNYVWCGVFFSCSSAVHSQKRFNFPKFKEPSVGIQNKSMLNLRVPTKRNHKVLSAP